MQNVPLSIKNALSTQTFLEVRSPHDQTLLATVEKADIAALEQALHNAHESYEEIMRTMPAWKRAEILYKVADQIKAHHEKLSMTIAQEGGKPLKDARVEVTRAVNTVRMSGNEALQMNGETLTMDRATGTENHIALSIRQGIGPVLAISAFNHPVNLICHQVATAFAAGNSVIVKPASQTPLSALRIVDFFYNAGLPREIISVAIVSGKDTEYLVQDARIKFITFIGSGAVGWDIEKKKHAGTRLSLEHGGTGTAIVTESADIEKVIPSIVRGGFYHAGQVCVSTQNVYVHTSLYREVLGKLIETASLLKVGPATEDTTDIGPIINSKEKDRILSHINEAVSMGAQIALGGKETGATTIGATILMDTTMDMSVMKSEIFGPVISVVPYSNIDEVIKIMNATPFSFQAAIYTQDINVALSNAKKIDATSVMINDSTAFRVDWMPFGGGKESGLGMGGIKNSIHEMSVEKMIVVKL